MNFRLVISKKQVLQLALFVGIIAVATALDIYFDENSVEINTAENTSEQSAAKPAKVYLFSQVNSSAAKISVQKNTERKLFEQHDKFLQRYHERKNFRNLKVKEKQPKTPLFLVFHYFLFRNHYFSLPDDDTHIS